jgi:hypothetical protein
VRTVIDGFGCRPVVVATITMVAVCSCESSFRHAIGTVSVINPDSICVARHNAMGDCYVDPSRKLIRAVQVGECVEATYVLPEKLPQPQLTAIQPANPARHRSDCPATLPTPSFADLVVAQHRDVGSGCDRGADRAGRADRVAR